MLIQHFVDFSWIDVIAAGNDENDISMYDIANIKIAMEDSFSRDLLKKADIISKSAKSHGIIDALKRAMDFKGVEV